MADHFPGNITIGGDISVRLLDSLSEMIASENVSIDWQYALDKAQVREAIEQAAATGQTVRFTDEEAVGGQFEELEAFLVRRRIHFDRHSDARYEYDGENAHYRGRGSPVVTLSAQNGDDATRCQEIQKTLAGRRSDQAKLEAIRKLIQALPPLAPIRFTGPSPRTGGKP